MMTSILSRDDLPFTARVGGADIPWHPRRSAPSPEAAIQQGFDYVQALAALARVDEHAAWQAAQLALMAPQWNCQLGEEEGFSDGLCRGAVIGWRAQAQMAALPFETRFEPVTAQWLSLHMRVELMEAQLRAMKVKPWRTYAEAGLE